MFEKGMKLVTSIISGFSIGMIRGPLSFGFLSSIKAGENIRRISSGVVASIMMISVRFGIIVVF